MSKLFQRVLASILCFVMVFSVVPVQAFASETAEAAAVIETEIPTETTPAEPAAVSQEAEPAPAVTEPAPEVTEPAPEETEPVPEETEPAPEETEPLPEETEPPAVEITPEDGAEDESMSTAEPVTVSSVTVTEGADGRYTVVPTVSGGNGIYVFNYWMYDPNFNLIAEHTNTLDTSWTVDAPAPGTYTVCVYGTDNTFTTASFAYSAWFTVVDGDLEPVVVSNVGVSGSLFEGEPLTFTPTVTGGNGIYVFNYWMYDANSQLVAEHLNTTDTSWTVNAPAEGIYTVCVFATDNTFVTNSYIYSNWFAVAPKRNVILPDVPQDVEIGAGETVVLSFTAPADGTYHFFSTSDYDTYGYLYADEACTERLQYNDDDGEGNNFYMSYTLAANETVYLAARFYSSNTTGTITVYAMSRLPLSVEFSISNRNPLIGSTNRVWASTNGENVVYSYFLLDANGNTLDSLTDTTETEWNFTVPGPAAAYTVQLVATDGVDTITRTCTFTSEEFFDSVSLNKAELSLGETVTGNIFLNVAWGDATVNYWVIDANNIGVLQVLGAEASYLEYTPTSTGTHTVHVEVTYEGTTTAKDVTFNVTEIPAISLDQTQYLAYESGKQYKLSFTAPADGIYQFSSSGSMDPHLKLYDNASYNGSYVSDDDSGPSMNFLLGQTMAAGETVYLMVYFHSGRDGESIGLTVTSVPFGINNMYFDYTSAMVTGKNTVYVSANDSRNTQYSYYLMDTSGNVLEYLENSTESSWEFTVPAAEGAYSVKVIASNGTSVAEETATFSATIFRITSISTSSNAPGTSGALYAYTNAGDTEVTYNFYVLDEAGNTVSYIENATSNRWETTIPTTPGKYTVLVCAVCNGYYAESRQEWLVGQFLRNIYFTDSMVQVGTEQTVYLNIQSYAQDAFTANYWILDENENVVFELLNSTEDSVVFTPSAAGRYTVRVTAAYNGYAMTKESSFNAFGTETLVLDQTVNKAVSYSSGNSYYGFAFTAPADGTYFFYSDSNGCDPNAELYADSDYSDRLGNDSDSGSGNNFLISREMTAGQTVYLLVRVYAWSNSSNRNFSVTAATRIPLVINYLTMNSWSPMIGVQNTVSVDCIATPGTMFSFFLMDSSGNVLDYLSNSTESEWTFTVPSVAGRYGIKVIASDGVDLLEHTEYFNAQNFKIDHMYAEDAQAGGNAHVYAYTNANSAEGITYSFFLMDANGNVLNSLSNVLDNHWSFTAPETAGNYNVVCYAAYNGQTSQYTCNLAVDQFLSGLYCSNAEVAVGTTVVFDAELAHYVDNTYVGSFWILDSNGNVVAEKLNTTDRSWSYTATAAGAYTARYAVTHNGYTMSQDRSFTVLQPTVLMLDQPVSSYSNSTNKCYPFQFTAPAYGEYFFTTTSNGQFDLDRVAQVYSAVPSSRNVYYSRVMNAGETIVLWVRSRSIGNFSVTVSSDAPLVLSNVYIEWDGTNLLQGGQATVTMEDYNAVAYNFYLIDISGNIVLQNLGSTENEWTFTVPGSGYYQALVYATDGVTTVERYSSWVHAFAQAGMTLDTEVVAYGAAVEYLFVAPETGYYEFSYRAYDGVTEWISDESYYAVADSYIRHLEAGNTYRFYLWTKNSVAAGVVASISRVDGNPLALSFEYTSHYIGGYPMTVNIREMTNTVTDQNLSGTYYYELIRYNTSTKRYETVQSSGWTYATSHTFTLPDNDTSSYRIKVTGSPDGVNTTVSTTDTFIICPSNRVVGLTEGVAWTGNLGRGNAFVFQAPEAGTYFVNLPETECSITTSGGDEYFEYSYLTIELEQGEWLYISTLNVISGKSTVEVTRNLTMAYVSYNQMMIAGTEHEFWAYAYVPGNINRQNLTCTWQMFSTDGTLVYSKTEKQSDSYYDCYMTLPQSGSYFVRATVTDGVQTTYMDSEIFTVARETTITVGQTVYGNEYTGNVYKFVAPASGLYTFNLYNGSDVDQNAFTWVDTMDTSKDYIPWEYSEGMDGPNGYYIGSVKLTRGEEIYIYVGNVSGTYSLTITR